MHASQRTRRPLASTVVTALLAAGLVTGAAHPGSATTDVELPVTVMFNNFETTVQTRAPAWNALDVPGPSGTPATASFSTDDVRSRISHARSRMISNRDHPGDGAQMAISPTLLTAGQTYTVSAWVYVAPTATRLDEAAPVEARLAAGGTPLPAVAGTDHVLTPGTFKRVEATYTHAAGTTPLSISVSNTLANFFIDDVMIATTRLGTPIVPGSTFKDALPYPVGAAVEERSTWAGSQAEQLLSANFDQVTPENAMKPESWYGPDNKFVGTEGAVLRENIGANALMDWAVENDGNVYGHTLLWHSQIPPWFFRDENNVLLTSSEAHRAILRERMRTHIFNVAEYLYERYGAFGSPGNPLNATDVVNEVIADSTAAASNGLRTSSFYNILGEEWIDLAFHYAEEAFNQTYAAEGADRPVTLFINEYGTEGGDGPTTKLQRYYDLTARMLDRGVPLDGIGNQFHVSLNTNVNNLRVALEKQAALGLLAAVTELDVTTGFPPTERTLIRQGHYYARAFDIFNQFHADNPGKLFCVTVWGLNDAGSWLYYSGAPLLFDDHFQPKWALVGAIGGTVPEEPKAMTVFGGSVAIGPDATSDAQWDLLRPAPIGQNAAFSLRWAPDHLTAYVRVTDGTKDATDGLTFVLGSDTYTFARSGQGSVRGVATETGDGWAAVVHLPLTGAAQGNVLRFNATVTDGATTTGWNSPGIKGELTLVEALSSVQVPQVPVAPTIDGSIDAAWARATAVTTGKQLTGSNTASAQVRTLWSGDGRTLYVLAEVTDPVIDLSATNPWEQDSVEIFVDAGNAKNGTYRPDDTQIRINADNRVTLGTGNAAAQAARVTSATTRTDGGYLVEASIDLLAYGGPRTVHGLDFQVNDASGGVRRGVRTWADPTNQGFSSTARWGVARLADVDASVTVAPASTQVRLGTTRQFTADVVFAAADSPLPWSGAVTWTLDGATSAATTLDADGLLTVGADEAIGSTLTVTATSDDNPTRSGSAVVTVVPGTAVSTTKVELSPVSVQQGRPVVVTATVAPPRQRDKAPAPTREVWTTVGGTPLPAAALTPGPEASTATLTIDTAGLPVGRHTVIVRYAGDSVYGPSQASITLTVRAAP